MKKTINSNNYKMLNKYLLRNASANLSIAPF